jgi:uncharacterized protein involved in exopolysaccharide biosynthesis
MIAQNEVEQIRREMQSARVLPTPAPAGQQQVGGPVTLAQLKEQLSSLLGNYTEQHPDVVRLKRKIAEMEAKEPVPNSTDIRREAASASDAPENISSPPLREAVGRRIQAENNIANIQAEANKINQQIREYQMRIERTPQREEQLLALRRDYENIKNAYNSLLSRKMEAEMAVSIQKKNKGEQFRVIDYAKLPEKPVSPNMNLLFLMFSAAGLGIGGAIIFMYEFFDTSIRKPETLQERLAVPVLMVMPEMQSAPSTGGRLLSRLELGLSAAGVLVCLSLLACLASVTVLNDPRLAQMIRGIVL